MSTNLRGADGDSGRAYDDGSRVLTKHRQRTIHRPVRRARRQVRFTATDPARTPVEDGARRVDAQHQFPAGIEIALDTTESRAHARILPRGEQHRKTINDLTVTRHGLDLHVSSITTPNELPVRADHVVAGTEAQEPVRCSELLFHSSSEERGAVRSQRRGDADCAREEERQQEGSSTFTVRETSLQRSCVSRTNVYPTRGSGRASSWRLLRVNGLTYASPCSPVCIAESKGWRSAITRRLEQLPSVVRDQRLRRRRPL